MAENQQQYEDPNGMDSELQFQRQAMADPSTYQLQGGDEDYMNAAAAAANDQLDQGAYPVDPNNGFSQQANAGGASETLMRGRGAADDPSNGGFVSAGRTRDRHVPPRDFPHPHPNLKSQDEGFSGYAGNDLVIPGYSTGNPPLPAHLLEKYFSLPSRFGRMDPNLLNDVRLPPSIRQQARLQLLQGSNRNKVPKQGEAGSQQQPLAWCEEHRDGPSLVIGGSRGELWEFGVVGSVVDTFFPKPGDVLILANERKGCPWPAFDGHLEIYVDEDYFTKSSVALQWNYTFNDGDLVIRFGDFDRHWRWRPSDQIHVFLRDNGVFFLVSRQQAQELHPLDFKFVDPQLRQVHSIQYHFRPRIGDFVLRKRSDDSYIWDTSWWHPGGDSHLLLKHTKALRRTYPQGPDPKYRWTFLWHRRGVWTTGSYLRASPLFSSLAASRGRSQCEAAQYRAKV